MAQQGKYDSNKGDEERSVHWRSVIEVQQLIVSYLWDPRISIHIGLGTVIICKREK